ncbi:SdrD B-like domain-containing protein, partial [Macrococcus capreoli]
MKKTTSGKRYDFIANKLNKYSIRKFTVGTASILIGSLMFLGEDAKVEAAETATTEAATTEAPTTEKATTEAATTEAPTTEAATTEALTTEASTTEASTTEASTTEAPSTEAATTEAPTTEAPTTEASTTEAATTEAPTTEAPTTEAATTEAPTTEASTTEASTTEPATTEASTTEAPTTEAPTTASSPSIVAPTVESINSTTEKVQTTTDSTEKTTIVNGYIAETLGVTAEEAQNTFANMNLDVNTMTSDELMAGILKAIAEKQNETNVLATPVETTSNTSMMESISLASLDTTMIQTLDGTPTNVNSLVTASNMKFSDSGEAGANGEVWITSHEEIQFDATYEVNDDVQMGDYFTVQLGQNLGNPGELIGFLTDLYAADGSMIAKASYDETTKTITYTFTNYVDLYDNVQGSLMTYFYPDKTTVTTDKTSYPLTIDFAGETHTNSLIFDYGNNPDGHDTVIGTTDKMIGNDYYNTTYINQDNTNLDPVRITITPTGLVYDSLSDIKIYSVNPGYTLPDSFHPDMNQLTDVSSNFVTKIDPTTGKVTIDFGSALSTGQTFVIMDVATLKTGFTGEPMVRYDMTTNNFYDPYMYEYYKGNPNVSAYFMDIYHANKYETVKPTSTGTGTTPAQYNLGNYVWLDANKDGIQDAAETPVAGVTVKLMDNTGKVIGTTTTDSTGHYVFTGLSNGDYQVQFVPPTGYDVTTANSTADDTVDSDPTLKANGMYTANATINNADNMTIDAGLYSLSDTTSSSLSDSLSNSLSDSVSNSLSDSLSNSISESTSNSLSDSLSNSLSDS